MKRRYASSSAQRPSSSARSSVGDPPPTCPTSPGRSAIGELRAAIDRVASDPAVRAALAEMRRAIRRGGGAARGADLVEGYLR
nr:hypothetical protein [Kitasatospora aureofaciens]